ncbi:hypothetical protein, conserved [Leishmania shawi]|uniref:Uncharacterized protein n=1 Tax=Leishmania shawi TaxID=5680 RepID=A0ABR3E3Z2_9TRYP
MGMSGRSNAAPSEAVFPRRVTLSPHCRQPAHRHARPSPACTPHPSYEQLTFDAAHHGTPLPFGDAFCCWVDNGGDKTEPHRSRPKPTLHAAPGGFSSSHLRQHHHHHDPFIHYSTSAPFMKCGATSSMSASPTPDANAAHMRRVKHRPYSRTHYPRSAASASAQQLWPSEAQARWLRSQRGDASSAVVEEKAPNAHLARPRCDRQLSPLSSQLLDSPTRAAIPTFDIMRLDASPSRSRSSRRAASRVRRLLCALEAEAQRAGCTATDAASAQGGTAELYQSLFLQALADGAAWERHARALEASVQVSAKREVRLTRQLRHARRTVALLAAYVEGAERVVDVLSRGTASGTVASTQTDRTVPSRTPPTSPSALIQSALVGATVDMASASPWRPTSRSAVSELIQGSLGCSLNLVYGTSGSSSRYGEDEDEVDDAESVTFAASDATVPRIDEGLRTAAVKRPGDWCELHGLHSESLTSAPKVVERRWDQPSWDGHVDDVGTDVHARYEMAMARECEDRGNSVQRLHRGGTVELETPTAWSRELPAAVRASGVARRESASSFPHAGTTAPAAAAVEDSPGHPANSLSPSSPSVGRAVAINTAMRTESVTPKSAPLDAVAVVAAAPQVAPTSVVHSLLELLRSRDTTTQATATLGHGRVATSPETDSNTTAQIAAAHHLAHYQATVAEATQSHSSGEAAHPRRVMPAMASSSSSSASRQPLLAPSCSPILRQSSEPKAEGNTLHAASLPSLASSLLPQSHSHALAPQPPQLPRGGDSGCSNCGPLAKEAAAVGTAPVKVTELIHTPSPASFSFSPRQTSTHLTDTHQHDGSVTTHSDNEPVYLSSDWESLETASLADDSGKRSSSSPKRQLEEARDGHHRAASSNNINGENITDERANLADNDGYAEWRAQLEAHLNCGWVSGM